MRFSNASLIFWNAGHDTNDDTYNVNHDGNLNSKKKNVNTRTTFIVGPLED